MKEKRYIQIEKKWRNNLGKLFAIEEFNSCTHVERKREKKERKKERNIYTIGH